MDPREYCPACYMHLGTSLTSCACGWKMLDPMPRQDLELPPPVGFVLRAEHERIVAEARNSALEEAAVYCNAVSLRGNDMERTKYRLAAGLPMTIDELKKLLSEATPGPWSLPHLARDNVTCNCGYVFAEYGGMGSIATIDVAESNRHPWGDDNGPCLSAAKANARLIAQAPDLLAEVIALREREARLVEVLAIAAYACRIVDEAVKEGHPSLPALVNHFLRAVEPARAAIAEIEKEAGE